MSEIGSPTLQAKKQTRDAKRKKLEEIFDSHKKHEQRTHLQMKSKTATGESSREQKLNSPSTDENSVHNGDAIPEVPDYANSSYQHTNVSVPESQKSSANKGGTKAGESDIEEGGRITTIETKTNLSYGGISVVNNDEESHGLSLRTEVQSLIHNDSDPDDVILTSTTLLEKFENNPQRILGAFLVFLFFLWWF